MKTPALPPGNPPDYINIPEHLRTQPVPDVTNSRLRRLLEQASVRRLGNLHGRRLADLEGYPGCGESTIWALRDMIIRALYPGVEPDLEMWPIPVSRYKPRPSLEVSARISHFRLQDLPVSTRLELDLRRMGIERLGHLNGLPVHALLIRPNFGKKTLAELHAVLRRAEAGDFSFTKSELAPKTPADLLWLLDDLVRQLPGRQRRFLELYFGASKAGPRTLAQIARRSGISPTAIHHQLADALETIRRRGSSRLLSLVERVMETYATKKTLLSPELVLTWQHASRPFHYPADFYARLIPRLRPRPEAAEAGAKRRDVLVAKRLPDPEAGAK